MSYSFDRNDECFIPATEQQKQLKGRYQTLAEVIAIDTNKKAKTEIFKIIDDFEPRK